ncbi:hypothetical protein COV16_05605 [Candidatus Woesearchaeota archaeon CG10_big_fil_rev_8_21_14_0_10_34_8]|nr:MAG: hypothetical protein COV16_05605 [Candidatus Woesearchaeota archaeon CG10_big_fil_rev_8_21_14_0_10_34_8]
MIITISGKPGSGKSTLAKGLARKLNYAHYSTGDYMRMIAKKKGITLLELSRIAEHDPSIDRLLDKWQKNLGETKNNFVLDARLGFHFIPHSIKIFVDIKMNEASRRIYHDQRFHEIENKSHKATLSAMKRRLTSEKKRYKSLYKINYPDKTHYDLVIDSTKKTSEQTLQESLSFINDFISKY